MCSPWQQPDNPDPKGINLHLLARALESFVQGEGESKGCTYAVFLDFLSLFQKGSNGEERTKAEAELFSRALSNMMMWYAHPKVLTLKLTALPQDYPTGFTFPSGMVPNTADYFGRGCALSSFCRVTCPLVSCVHMLLAVLTSLWVWPGGAFASPR